jgi:hypothetical protein
VWPLFRFRRGSVAAHPTILGVLSANRTCGQSRIGTCTISALLKHLDYFCTIRPRQAHFRMFSSRKANTSGSQMFTPRWRKSCPSSTVWPMGGIDFQAMRLTDVLAAGVQHLAGREGVIVLGVNEQDRLRDVVNGRWELCSQLRRTIELYPAPEKTTIQVFLAKSKAAECAKTTLRESLPTVR